MFSKVIFRKSGRTLHQKKTPKNSSHWEKKDIAQAGEWKWETIALVPKKSRFYVKAALCQCFLLTVFVEW